MRALAVTARERSPLAPEVPTFAEQGFPGYEVVEHVAMLAPAGTPEPIIARLNATCAAALTAFDMQSSLCRTTGGRLGRSHSGCATCRAPGAALVVPLFVQDQDLPSPRLGRTLRTGKNMQCEPVQAARPTVASVNGSFGRSPGSAAASRPPPRARAVGRRWPRRAGRRALDGAGGAAVALEVGRFTGGAGLLVPSAKAPHPADARGMWSRAGAARHTPFV